MKRSLDLLHTTDELRRLILENPDLPLLVCTYEDAADSVCDRVSVEIGEFLDCEQEYDDEHIFTDRDYFEEAVTDYYYNDFDGTDDEFDEFINSKLDEFEPYWKKCIIMYCG